MKQTQRGFAHVGLIVLAVVVLLIGVSGWFIYSKNKVSNPEPSIVPVQEKQEVAKDNPKAELNTTLYKISDLNISLELPAGWGLSRSVEATYGNIDNVISSTTSDIKISAYVAEFPVGFSGCTDGIGELSEFVVDHLSDTNIAEVVVFGTSQHGLMLADETLKLGTAEKSLEAETLTIAEMKVGNTYYYCSAGTPPISWSVDFDKNTSNHDGVSTALISDKAGIVRPTSTGYDETVKILQSAKTL